MPMNSPGSVPKTVTPSRAATRGDEVGACDPPELATEALGVRVVEVDEAGTSMSSTTAAMTTAASVASGGPRRAR